MALNKRERNLVFATTVLVVVGVNYLLVAPLWRKWQASRRELATQRREVAGMRDQIARQPQRQKEYDTLRASLGQGQERFTQTSEVLKKLEEVGAGAGILINARRPMAPVDKGVYRELPVQCSFEANTESLVKFLYGLQTGSGFINVEQLQIFPRADNPDILRCDIQIRALATKEGGGA